MENLWETYGGEKRHFRQFGKQETDGIPLLEDRHCNAKIQSGMLNICPLP